MYQVGSENDAQNLHDVTNERYCIQSCFFDEFWSMMCRLILLFFFQKKRETEDRTFALPLPQCRFCFMMKNMAVIIILMLLSTIDTIFSLKKSYTKVRIFNMFPTNAIKKLFCNFVQTMILTLILILFLSKTLKGRRNNVSM